jgi:outer membrane lipoprotein-sorting protein
MAHPWKAIGWLLGCWWVLLVLTVPGMARGAEFSALLLVKDGGKAMPGKLYVLDGKMRQDFIDEEGQTITIVRPDKKVVWVIIPQERTYMEMPLKIRLPGQFIQIPPQALGKRLVGKDRVSGYEVDQYEVTVPGRAGPEKQTFWVAPKLGLPIKMECRPRHFSLEYTNIKEGGVPARLFNLPPGLHKTTLAGFADEVER